MNIKEEIHGLVHLQEIDSRLQEIEEMREALYQAIQRVREPLTQVEGARDELISQIAGLRGEIPQIERTVQELTDKIAKSQAKLPLITTQKEYFALQKEVEGMQKEKGILEDRQLQRMGQLDEIQKKKDELAAQCTEQEALFHKNKEKMESETSQYETESVELKARRESISREIGAKYLKLYNKVLTYKGSPAVVRIVDGNCQGCHMTLPPQLYNDVRKGETLITCSYCNRILYSEK